jgi:hypothetical protein
MDCPVCHADNDATALSCTQCGSRLSSDTPPASEEPPRKQRKPRSGRRRGLPEVTDSPFADRGEGNNRTALTAYRLSIYGLIPGLGLFLGPVAAVMGWWARWQGRQDPDFKSQNPALAAVWIGLALALTQWGGLALMVWGLWPR